MSKLEDQSVAELIQNMLMLLFSLANEKIPIAFGALERGEKSLQVLTEQAHVVGDDIVVECLEGDIATAMQIVVQHILVITKTVSTLLAEIRKIDEVNDIHAEIREIAEQWAQTSIWLPSAKMLKGQALLENSWVDKMDSLKQLIVELTVDYDASNEDEVSNLQENLDDLNELYNDFEECIDSLTKAESVLYENMKLYEALSGTLQSQLTGNQLH